MREYILNMNGKDPLVIVGGYVGKTVPVSHRKEIERVKVGRCIVHMMDGLLANVFSVLCAAGGLDEIEKLKEKLEKSLLLSKRWIDYVHELRSTEFIRFFILFYDFRLFDHNRTFVPYIRVLFYCGYLF